MKAEQARKMLERLEVEKQDRGTGIDPFERRVVPLAERPCWFLKYEENGVCHEGMTDEELMEYLPDDWRHEVCFNCDLERLDKLQGECVRWETISLLNDTVYPD